MEVKFIVSDIDGTIINSNREVSNYTIEVVRKLPALGIHFALATGRSKEGAFRIANQIGLEPSQYGVISLNGLRVYQGNQELLFEEKGLTYEDCQVLEKIGKNFYLGVLYCFDDKVYLQMDDRTYQDYTIALNPDKLRYFKEDTSANTILSLTEIKHRFEKGDQMLKVVFMQSDDYMDLIIKRVQKACPLDYECFLVGPGWVEIMPSTVNKGTALSRYAKLLNLDLKSTVAFGDAENDISMFKVVNKCIAMENAFPTLKEIASDITKSNYEDGVAVAISKLLNIK